MRPNPLFASDDPELVRQLVAGTTWTNRKGVTAPVGLEDILVIAPYNAALSP